MEPGRIMIASGFKMCFIMAVKTHSASLKEETGSLNLKGQKLWNALNNGTE